MIEIGRRDFIGRGQLSMDLFEGNRSFIGVNLASLSDLYQEYVVFSIRVRHREPTPDRTTVRSGSPVVWTWSGLEIF